MFAVAALLLVVGTFAFVGGAGQIARRYGASPYAVGMGIIPLGVCVPVLAVASAAVLHDRHMLAVGTIVGSIVVNVGFAFGVSACFRPPAGSSRVVAAAIPALLVSTLLFWFLCRDHEVSRADGAILLVAFAGAAIYLVRQARRESVAVKSKFADWNWQRRPPWLMGPILVLGAAALVAGAILMVPAAVELANKEWRSGTRVFGLTVMALIVSAPGYLVVKSAAHHRHTDLVFGVIVGASLCNLLLVAGVTAMIAPFGVTPQALFDDIPIMAIFAFLLLTPLLNGLRLHRWEGVLLICAYLVFVMWLIHSA